MKLLDRYGRELHAGDHIAIFEPSIAVGTAWMIIGTQDAVHPQHGGRMVQIEASCGAGFYQRGDVANQGILRIATKEEVEQIEAESKLLRDSAIVKP